MIPPDVASALRSQLPDQARIASEQPQNQPVASTQRVTDVLRDMQPGQRIMAEIQAMMPNGTYRAMVAQREVTLALPFSAKPGDSLELEVRESHGSLILAVAGESSARGGPGESVATTLSQTGKLIADLLGEIDSQGRRAPPAPLNGSQPLVATMPEQGADLAPLLKQALSQSGVFYEAHQARWAAGEFPTTELLQEPQGRYSHPNAGLQSQPSETALRQGVAGNTPDTQAHASQIAESAKPPVATPGGTVSEQPVEGRSSLSSNVSGNAIPADLTRLVQQQLDALATQTFAWQGQVWPGQDMQWEIEQYRTDEQARGSADDAAITWRTRLNLRLPQLGGLSANLSLLPGNELKIELAADSSNAESRLNGAAPQLVEQMASAGLSLTQMTIKHDEPNE